MVHHLASFLIAWVALAFAMWVASKLLKDFKVKGGAWSFAVIAAVYAVLDFVLATFLFRLFGVLTLGVGFLLAVITRLVVAALLLLLTDRLTTRLTIRGFGTAFVAALIIAVTNQAAQMVLAQVLRELR